MKAANPHRATGIGMIITALTSFLFIGGIVLVILRFAEVITWSWWLVTLPLIVSGSIWVLGTITLIIVILVAGEAMYKRRSAGHPR